MAAKPPEAQPNVQNGIEAAAIWAHRQEWPPNIQNRSQISRMADKRHKGAAEWPEGHPDDRTGSQTARMAAKRP